MENMGYSADSTDRNYKLLYKRDRNVSTSSDFDYFSVCINCASSNKN